MTIRYMVLSTDWNVEHHAKKLEEELNRLGLEGWVPILYMEDWSYVILIKEIKG